MIEGIPNVASNSQDYVLRTRQAKSCNNAVRCKRLVVLMIISIVQEPVSALQENDVMYLGSSFTPVEQRLHAHPQEMPIIRGPE